MKNSSYEEDVRKTAAIGLGVLNKSDLIIQNFDEIVNFDKIINKFAKVENSPTQLMIDLEHSAMDESLNQIDYFFRLGNNINETSRVLREQRDWYLSNQISNIEKEFIEQNNLIGRIDSTLDYLSYLQKRVRDSLEFNRNTTIQETTVKVINALDEFETKKDDNDKILFEKVKSLRLNLINSKSNFDGNQDETARIYKYQTIISKLLTEGVKGAREVFKKVAQNESTAISIRCDSIEALGIIGNKDDIKLLLSLSKSPLTDIKISAIKAITLILYGKKEKNEHLLGEFNLDLYE